MNRSIAHLVFLASAILGSAAALTGCGDACEEAAAKTEECLGGDGEVYQGSQPECSGAIACSAECTVEASCEDIYAYFRHLSTSPQEEKDEEPPYDGTQNKYEVCVLSCAGQQ